MPSYIEVLKQLESIGIDDVTAYFGRKEIKELPSILFDNEVIEKLFSVSVNSSNGILIATNLRLVIVDKKLLWGKEIFEIDYSIILSIQQKEKLLANRVTLYCQGFVYTLDVLENTFAEFSKYLRGKIGKSNTTNNQTINVYTDNDIITKLERLIALRDSGDLSEFQYKQQREILLNSSNKQLTVDPPLSISANTGNKLNKDIKFPNSENGGLSIEITIKQLLLDKEKELENRFNIRLEFELELAKKKMDESFRIQFERELQQNEAKHVKEKEELIEFAIKTKEKELNSLFQKRLEYELSQQKMALTESFKEQLSKEIELCKSKQRLEFELEHREAIKILEKELEEKYSNSIIKVKANQSSEFFIDKELDHPKDSISDNIFNNATEKESSERSTKTKFCRKCGTKNQFEARFCGNCRNEFIG